MQLLLDKTNFYKTYLEVNIVMNKDNFPHHAWHSHAQS